MWLDKLNAFCSLNGVLDETHVSGASGELTTGTISYLYYSLLIFFESISKSKVPARFFCSHFFQLLFSFTFAFPKKWVKALSCFVANELIQKVL